MKKTHDYIHYYRGYWSDGGRCRIRIYQGGVRVPVVICSQLPDNDNTSVTNMAEYLAAEVIAEYGLPTPLIWVEHYPEHEGDIGEYSLVTFSVWALEKACLGGIWRLRIGVPSWSHLRPEEVEFLLRDRTGDDHDASRRYKAVPGRAEPYGPDTHCIPVEANLRALHASYTALREAASWGHRKPAPTPPGRT